jgi:hypothetical protein
MVSTGKVLASIVLRQSNYNKLALFSDLLHMVLTKQSKNKINKKKSQKHFQLGACGSHL